MLYSFSIWGGIPILSRIILFILLLNAELPVHAQDLQYAQQIIATLCSEKMKGRGYVKKGDKHSAAYIRKELKKIGLDPLTENYYQPFQLKVNTFPSKMELVLDGRKLTPGIDFMVDPSSPGIKGEYRLKVIKATDLIEYDSLVFEQSQKEHFILVDNRGSMQLDTKAKELLAKRISIFQNSLNPNAMGIIELTSEKLNWGISGTVFLKPYIKVNYTFDPVNLDNVYISLSNCFKKKYTSRNIAGYIRGTERPDSFLVFTAHYDHLGIMGSNTFFPGANDNASGVAMLLYLARYFQLNPPRTSIIFLFFSAEELGLIGSSFFTQHTPIELSKIKFLVNFDMVGTGSEGIKIVNGNLYENEFQALVEINNLDHFVPVISGRGHACISDHCPFDYQGVPGFYIYTEGESPDYHSIYDRLENLSLSGFEGLARLMICFVGHF